MSGVYQRNREVSEYKFFTQAIAIRVEVNKLMASSSVVPKAYRLLNAVPTVETARSICLLYTSPSPRDAHESRMPSSA